jgi:hypothetical protein
MVQVRHPHGPPMNLGNMRKQGVRGLSVTCLNHACWHHTVVNVDSYPHEVEVPCFGSCLKCSKYGVWRVDVRPNWKEASPVQVWRGRSGMAGDKS